MSNLPPLSPSESFSLAMTRKLMHTIIQDWGLNANEAELIAAIHVIQSFIKQHYLHRIDPDEWSSWWDNE